MVANQPIERPGSEDFLINKLRAAKRQADEQTRQSKFPIVISHQDPTSQARIVDFQILPGTNGAGAVLSVFDGSGHLVMGTDPDTGYGLSQPQTQVPMYPSNPGLLWNSSTSFASYQTGQVQQNNSCFLAQWRMNNSWGGTGAASVVASYVKIYDSVTGWSWTSPTVTSGSSTTTAPGVLTTCGPYAVQVPQASIGNFFGIDIFCRVVSGGASSAVAVTPLTMIGTGLAFAAQWIGGTTSS